MDRKDTYVGQIVAESDVDEWFDQVEDAEHNALIDAKVAQGLLADTPSIDIYGGIVKGLTMSGVGGSTLTLALGQARDQLGQRISIPAGATIDVTKTGDTVIGETTAAIGDGALITGSCGAGAHIVATLSVYFAQNPSNPKVDALGNTINYDLDESFRFNIRIGSSFNHALVVSGGASPSRAALLDGYIVLADLLLTNTASVLSIVAIMETSIHWRSLGGNYTTFNGRRSSWLAIETDDEFTQPEAGADVVRANSAREALYTVARKQASAVVLSHRDAGAPGLYSTRKRYGHIAAPHEFFDEMIYSDNDIDLTLGYMGPWVLTAAGGGSLGPFTNWVSVNDATPYGFGGVISAIGRAGSVTEGIELTLQACWRGAAAPQAMGHYRFLRPSALPSSLFRLGLVGTATSDWIYISESGGQLTAQVAGSTGTGGTAVNLGAFANNTWYTCRFFIKGSTSVLFQLNNGPWTEAKPNGADSLSNNTFSPRIFSRNGATYIDQVHCSDSRLSSDMY